MADDGEVLELDADGTFNIPSPKKVKPQQESRAVTNIEDQTTANEPIEEKNGNGNFNSTDNTKREVDKLLDGISPGEFKVYRSKVKKMLHVIVRIREGQSVDKVELTQNKLYIGLKGSNEDVSVDLPQDVRPETASSKSYEDYITVVVNYS